MRPIPKPFAVTCMSVLLIAVAAGCGGNDPKSSTNTAVLAPVGTPATEPTVAAPTPTAAAPTPTVAAPTPTAALPTTGASAAPTSVVAPVSSPKTDPCALLTAAIASEALGVPVGDQITQPGQGNTTCGYRPADPAAKGFVSLTLYSVAGSTAVLDAAAAQFPDAEPVDGVGDGARLSLHAQAIGVLSGGTVFALGLFPQLADGQLAPVTKDQLIVIARAVLAGH